MSSSASTLTAARYGKDLVRVLRVVREENRQIVAEYNVRALVEGDLETSFTHADNTLVVATDSIKNTIYCLAKTSPHVLSPELFALHIATHFVTKYQHISKAFVDIEKLKWSRITIGEGPNGQEHKHSFVRDGDEKRTVSVEVDATLGKNHLISKVTAGLKDLLVLKSSGSGFKGFYRDEFTTLVEVDDRILSTSVDMHYTLSSTVNSKGIEGVEEVIGTAKEADRVAEGARKTTLELFALDESASVQATLFKMGQRVIQENIGVSSVSYSLPNKHYLPVDLSYIGLNNSKPTDAEARIVEHVRKVHQLTLLSQVFCPISSPSGLISATVSRTVAMG